MVALLRFIEYLIQLYEYVIIAAVILSLLIQTNVINSYSPFVRSLRDGLESVTEPLFRRIRRMLPMTKGLDFAPIVLLLACLFVRWVVIDNWLIRGLLG